MQKAPILNNTTRPKAMILAAGLGSRFKPWTDHHPKALAIVNGKSLLQRNIEYLQQFGINEVVVNVHHFANQIVDAIKKNSGWGSYIVISDETDEVLETGGGFLKAAPLLSSSEEILVMNADILTDLNLQTMIDFHQRNRPLATLATSSRQTSRYFLFDEENNLCGWKNVLTGEVKGNISLKGYEIQKAFNGIHVIDADIFQHIKRTGKFSMIDVYLDLMSHHIVKSFDSAEAAFIDVGKPESVGKAEILFA